MPLTVWFGRCARTVFGRHGTSTQTPEMAPSVSVDMTSAAKSMAPTTVIDPSASRNPLVALGRGGPEPAGFEPTPIASLGMRWFIDAMNVIGSRPDGWWRDRHAAMVGLVDDLERWAAADGDDVVVVFEQPPRPPIVSSVIEIAHAKRPRPNSADDEIVRRLKLEPQPAAIRVVTSDGVLAQQVHAAGASVYPSSTFRDDLDARR
jgi:predicted RNA-binding protein with PIN domain